jgi:hypothetical protein
VFANLLLEKRLFITLQTLNVTQRQTLLRIIVSYIKHILVLSIRLSIFGQTQNVELLVIYVFTTANCEMIAHKRLIGALRMKKQVDTVINQLVYTCI